MDRTRALGIDAVVALLVFAASAVAINAGLDEAGTAPRGWAYLVVGVIAALVLARRRWPVPVLVATAVLVVAYHAVGLPALPLALPVAVALYSAADLGHLRWAVGTALVLLIVSTAARLAEGDSAAMLFGYDLLSQAGLMAATIALGDAVRSRRRQHAAAAVERDREATRRVEDERLRIARELHDILAHTLSVVSLHTDVAREALEGPDSDLPAARRALAAVREAAGGAARELRATVGSLRTPVRPAPGLDRLDELVGATGLDVELIRDGDFSAVPALVASTAYRIVQESLTNVVRHADTRSVTVCLRQLPDTLTVRVIDDGRNDVAPQPGSGYGLTGIRERAELLGGRVSAGPAEDGWAVEAVLPLRGAS